MSCTGSPDIRYRWPIENGDEMNRFLMCALAAGAIVVLMVLLLGMNAIAIWLRNRFEQRW